MAIADLSNPTRTSVNQLFRDLQFRNRYDCAELRAMEAELEELKEHLLNVPKYKALELKLKKAKDIHHRRAADIRLATERAMRLFQARGLTPDVKKKINALVALANKPL